MATAKIRLEKSRQKKDGTYPVVFQIIHHRKKKVLYSPYHLREECFISEKGLAVNRKHYRIPKLREINQYLSSGLENLHQIIDKLDETQSEYTIEDVLSAYNYSINNNLVTPFMLRLIGDLDKAGRHGTKNAYQSTLSCLQRFMSSKELSFADITPRWLDQFVCYLRQAGSQPNTILFYTRILKAVFNKAQREELPGTVARFPFRNISLNHAKPRKRAVAEETIQELANLNLQNNTHLELSRDIFLFSFYSCGIPFVDIALLKINNIQGQYLLYNRAKTGQPLQVRLFEPQQAIIDKYKNTSPYLFPIIKAKDVPIYKQYQSGLRKHNRHLKELSQLLNLPTVLTSYVSRHSWASIAKWSGVPLTIISEGLGHSNEKTTYAYLASLKQSTLDEANEKLLMRISPENKITSNPKIINSIKCPLSAY